MHFRNGEPADIAAIQAIERASAVRFLDIGMTEIANDDPTPQNVLQERIMSRRLLVASDAIPVAFAMFDVVDNHFYIEQIDVAPSHGGKRIGAMLIALIESRARDEGSHGLLLSTFRHVAWNAPYYRTLGFNDIADSMLSPALLHIRQEHVHRGLDETRRVFMRKPLAPAARGDAG